jgi:hypothetical protein
MSLTRMKQIKNNHAIFEVINSGDFEYWSILEPSEKIYPTTKGNILQNPNLL